MPVPRTRATTRLTPPASVTVALTVVVRDDLGQPVPSLTSIVGLAPTLEMAGGVVSRGGGGGGGAWFTTIVTCLLVVPPHPVAVSVYVLVVAGLTVVEPGVGTPPISGSIIALVAFDTNPQLNVLD